MRSHSHRAAGRKLGLQLRRGRRKVSNEPYYTTSLCTNCRATVHGLNGRWTCTNCGTSSPYEAGPPLPSASDADLTADLTSEPSGRTALGVARRRRTKRP